MVDGKTRRSLLLHPGMGKAATTYTQGLLDRVPNALYLGKRPDGTFVTDELRRAHYSVFRQLDRFGKGERRSSFNLISAYAKLAAEEIRESQDSTVILSDECILDYGAYDGEVNALRLAWLVERLERELGEEFRHKSIVLTIREQASLLQSHYAYDYLRWKRRAPTGQKLIRLFSDDPFAGAFAALWFGELSDLLRLLFPGFEVRIAPCELLSTDSEEFRRCLIGTLPSAGMPVLGLEEPLNVNSRETPQGRVNVVREPTRWSALLWRLNPVGRAGSLLRRLGVVDTLPDWAIQGLQRLGRSVEPSVRYRKHAKEIQFGEAEKRVIRDRVARSNAKLAEDHSLDLQALGYAVADDPSVHAGTGLD